MNARPYETMTRTVREAVGCASDITARMQCVVDTLWAGMSARGVSWVGFYLIDNDQMILGPRRDKPACSPIGLHGACGQCFTNAAPLVVRDVSELGADYIACDPRDLSEVVLPFYDGGAEPIGVLDLDSFDIGSFDDTDVAGLTSVLHAADLGKVTH